MNIAEAAAKLHRDPAAFACPSPSDITHDGGDAEPPHDEDQELFMMRLQEMCARKEMEELFAAGLPYST